LSVLRNLVHPVVREMGEEFQPCMAVVAFFISKHTAQQYLSVGIDGEVVALDICGIKEQGIIAVA